MSPGGFLEVFVDAPSEVCRARDVKGLYRKSEAGKISNVAGRDQPYEHPEAPALVLRTTELDAQAAADRLFRLALAHV
jgi:bifunctional enzyme CysN/CysC